MIKAIEWFAVITALIGSYFLVTEKGHVYIPWILFLISNAAFILFATLTGAYGLMLLEAIYVAMNFYALNKRRHAKLK